MFSIPQCYSCAHYDRDSVKSPQCPAFPNGIPREIIRGEFDHRKPYPKDNGVRFKQASDRPKFGG